MSGNGDAISGIRLLRESVRTAWERGSAILVLFLFLGVLSFLGVNATADVSIQIAVVLTTVVFLTGAMVIALNTLVDSGTKIELSSMYLTDYKGIVWTTASFLLGNALFKGLLLTSSALFWYPFLTAPGNATVLIHQFITAPSALNTTQWYVLLVQAESLVLTIYLATRLMAFPAYIALENTSAITSLKRSWTATTGKVRHLVLPVLLTAVSTPVFLMAGLLVEPMVRNAAAPITVGQYNIGTHPYTVQLVSSGTVSLFIGAGLVLALSVVATTYSAVKQ